MYKIKNIALAFAMMMLLAGCSNEPVSVEPSSSEAASQIEATQEISSQPEPAEKVTEAAPPAAVETPGPPDAAPVEDPVEEEPPASSREPAVSELPESGPVDTEAPAGYSQTPAAPQQAASPQPEPAAPLNEGTVFEGYAVNVSDWNTPAAYSGGTDWPITTYYFFSQNGDKLGSISREALDAVTERNRVLSPEGGWVPPDRNGDWSGWFADAFNSFRNISGSSYSHDGRADFDAESYSLAVIELTNAEREKHGLHSLEIDYELMELAQIRAEEVSTLYSHDRPDGTRVARDLGYGENVGAKDSPEKQVNSWMNSDGHRTNILLERYNYIGVGCYRAENGNTYWVQIFSK